MLRFRLESCRYFWNLGGYPLIKSALKEDYFCSKKSWMDVNRITFLRNLYLKYHKSHVARSRLPYRLPIPSTNSIKRFFLYNAVKLWNCGIMSFLKVLPFFNYLQRCSEIQELSQNTFLWQSVLPIDGCCEDLEVSSVKWLKDSFCLLG